MEARALKTEYLVNPLGLGTRQPRLSWLCQGIRVDRGEITLAPHPHPSLGHAQAKYLSPVGEIVSGWRYDGDTVRYHFSLPVNTTARVILPDEREAVLGPGDHTM